MAAGGMARWALEDLTAPRARSGNSSGWCTSLSRCRFFMLGLTAAELLTACDISSGTDIVAPSDACLLCYVPRSPGDGPQLQGQATLAGEAGVGVKGAE